MFEFSITKYSLVELIYWVMVGLVALVFWILDTRTGICKINR